MWPCPFGPIPGSNFSLRKEISDLMWCFHLCPSTSSPSSSRYCCASNMSQRNSVALSNPRLVMIYAASPRNCVPAWSWKYWKASSTDAPTEVICGCSHVSIVRPSCLHKIRINAWRSFFEAAIIAGRSAKTSDDSCFRSIIVERGIEWAGSLVVLFEC